MERSRYARKVRLLWVMIFLALAYGSLLYFLHTLTGVKVADGVIGVLLGLYICSHPAANTIDVIFFDRFALRRLTSEWSGIRWLALNLLALVIGWVIIVVGATQLVGGSP